MAKNDKARIERERRAAEAYSEVTGATSLADLIKSVKRAQDGKGRQLSKRELKARNLVTKAEAAKKREEEAQAALLAAVAQEAELARQEAEAQAKATRAAETRIRRQKAVAAERARRESQGQKVKDLKRAVDNAIMVALKAPTRESVQTVVNLQQSLRSAWSVLPPSMQFAEDRAKLMANEEIKEDLKVILAQTIEDAKATRQQVDEAVEDAEETPAPKADPWARAKALAGRGRGLLGQGLGSLQSSAYGLLKAANLSGAGRSLMSMGRDSLGFVSSVGTYGKEQGQAMARDITAGIQKIGSTLVAAKNETTDWFSEKFGPMFRRLWSVVRNPLSNVKSGASWLSRMLGWGTLLSTVLLPMLKGVYDELVSKFNMDFVAAKFEEFKTWIFNAIKSFFSGLLPAIEGAGKKAAETVADVARPTVTWAAGKVQEYKAAGQKAGAAIGLPTVDPNNKTANPELRQLEDLYAGYKGAGNMVSRGLYAYQVKQQLWTMDPNVIPDRMAGQMSADGFRIPKKNALWANAPSGGSTAAVTAKGVASDGKTAAVMATPPPSASFSDLSGHNVTPQGSSPAAGVVSIPRQMGSDSIGVLNSGLLQF